MYSLIFTSENDQSTVDVIDWLLYYGKEFLVLSDETRYSIVDIDKDGCFTIETEGIRICSKEIRSVWFRRGAFYPKSITISAFDDISVSEIFRGYYNKMSAVLNEYVQMALLKANSINSQKYQSVNKLEVLLLAKELGLKVPEFIMTTQKTVLREFKNQHDNIITKDITDGIYFLTSSFLALAYTELITDDFLDSIPESFSLSFFQELIENKVDVRSFYLNGDFYSMAIFSQSNKRTSVDFRHYDKATPNRCVPFKLPNKIEEKLSKLLQTINLNSGSIDLIYSKCNDFVFLEVNPIGQFGMCSIPCNYYLEKKIAEFL